MVRNLPANARDIRDQGLVPGWGRYPGGGNGNPLQYSCLENPMDRVAQQTTVYRVAQSQRQLKYAQRHTTFGAAQTQIPPAMGCCYVVFSVGCGVLRSFPQWSYSTQLSADASALCHRSICLHAPDQLQQ